MHVLTLTATPIPRTLQLALTGVRDMSLIATPPVDRLAVRTFVTPFDGVTIREALLREQYRGGQSFYVCPRIEDLAAVAEQIRELVPEMRMAMAHGRLPPTQIENTMQDFVDGKFDLLLSTNIVECGLDIRNANTMIIHRADMFGLAQLYQLRGRIGRGKTRAYAYLTVPPGKALNEAASKRLEVMQTLDTLGAGFQLASHDLDIRGAGNLLGEEQSGHIREVGIELYQQLLEEAVASARGRAQEAEQGRMVADHQSRHPGADPRGIRRRPVGAHGPLSPARRADDPGRDRCLRRRAGRPLRQDAARGRVPAADHRAQAAVPRRPASRRSTPARRPSSSPSTRTSSPSPDRLIGWIQKNAPLVKLRPDHRVIVQRVWADERQRLSGVTAIVSALAKLAGAPASSASAPAEPAPPAARSAAASR